MRYSTSKSNSGLSRWPLWLQLAIFLMLVIVAAAAVGGHLIRQEVSSYLTTNLKDNSNKTFAILSSVSIDAVIAEDIPLLETIVTQATERDPNIVTMVIENSSGKQLMKWNRRENVAREDAMYLEQDITLENESFGKMKITLNAASMNRDIRQHVKQVRLMFIAILSLVAFLLIVGLHRVVIKPIRLIDQRLIGLKAGDLDSRVSISAARELMGLAKSVNDLGAAWKLKGKRERQLQEAQQALEISHDQLAEHSKNLESIVEARTAELATVAHEAQEAKREAEQANLSKSSFLATMSHELRTPLNAIIGYGEMLIEECGELEPEEYNADLDKIVSAGKHLLGLINDILDLSKIEAGKMDFFLEDFDLAETLEGLKDIIAPKVKENSNTFDLIIGDNIGSVHADCTKLRQCIINILGNASKFTENGTITLEAERYSQDGEDWISIAVSDTGIGMTPEQVAKLFQPFSQADSSTTRKFGGTGLGLTITRHFSQLMGGDITVKSEANVGSTFTLKIPAKVEDPSTRPALTFGQVEDSAKPEDNQTKVLVIDDDPLVHDLIRRTLKEGYWVRSAYRGEEGLRLAKEQIPDVITLDIMMPEMDGWQVINSLKQQEELSEVPVIVLSVVDDRHRGLELGAIDVLTKPINKDSLLTALGKLELTPKASS
jgi:signal transduction histidine kinase/ActR/RegA family two-component response regulator